MQPSAWHSSEDMQHSLIHLTWFWRIKGGLAPKIHSILSQGLWSSDPCCLLLPDSLLSGGISPVTAQAAQLCLCPGLPACQGDPAALEGLDLPRAQCWGRANTCQESPALLQPQKGLGSPTILPCAKPALRDGRALSGGVFQLSGPSCAPQGPGRLSRSWGDLSGSQEGQRSRGLAGGLGRWQSVHSGVYHFRKNTLLYRFPLLCHQRKTHTFLTESSV